MKKIKILSLFVCLIALLAACEDEDITPSYGARTVLVYIAGNNSLGQSDFDSKDVSEMIEGMKGTEGTTNNLLVYFAGYKKTAKLIRLIKNGKGEVKQETVMSYDKHNSVNLDVMKDVFRTAFSNYPAKSYGIVFWSHGDGWLHYQNPSTRWWGQDTSDGDYRMNISDLHEALSVTLHFAVMNVIVCMTTGFAIAMLLDHRSMRFRPFFRAVFYIPTIIPYVATAMVFMWMMSPDFGLFNIILKGLGFTGSKWIYSESTVLRSLLLITSWTAGNVMVVFLAGLQGVPRQLYEAVEVDGGNSLHKFMYVTIPMMTPIVFFNGLMFLIASLQGFMPAAVITAGGPNNATLFYTYYMYRQAFEFSNMGYASALGWILFVVIAIITGIVFKTSKYWVFYSDEE